MNVFKEMACSVAKPSAYPQFLRNKGGKIFGYGMLLMFFYFLLSVVVPISVFHVRTGGFVHVIRDEIPDFELSHFGFWAERPYSFEDSSNYIRVDSDRIFNEEEIYRLARRYNNLIVVDQEKLIVKNNGQIQTLYFYMLDYDAYISKQDILFIIPMIYLVLFVLILLYFVWITALFFLGVLLVSLPGLIINAVLKTDLTFGQIFKLALYGRTLPLLFKGVVLRMLDMVAFHITIPFFWVINFGVTLLYMFLAMKRMKEQREQSFQYAYQQNPYQQDGYGQDRYQQNAYEQNIYGQGYSGQADSHGQENGQNDPKEY